MYFMQFLLFHIKRDIKFVNQDQKKANTLLSGRDHETEQKCKETFSGTSPLTPATGSCTFPAFQAVSWRSITLYTVVIYCLNTFGNLTSYD